MGYKETDGGIDGAAVKKDGTWLGKEYAGLLDIMELYQIDDKKQVFELLKVCEDELGKFYAERRKQQEQLAKSQRGR